MKKNWPLIIGISLPFVMILLVGLSIYLPNAFAKPQDKFLYYTADRYDYASDRYEVQNGKLLLVPYSSPLPTVPTNSQVKQPEVPKATLHLYVFDAAKNSSEEVTFEQAQKFSLNTNIESPTGYRLERGTSDAGIFELFGGYRSDYNTWYLRKGAVNKKIELKISGNTDYYYNNLQFLGWITQ